MRNLFLAISMCWIVTVHVSAQESTFKKNDNVVSLGIGFGGILYTDYIYMGRD